MRAGIKNIILILDLLIGLIWAVAFGPGDSLRSAIGQDLLGYPEQEQCMLLNRGETSEDRMIYIN